MTLKSYVMLGLAGSVLALGACTPNEEIEALRSEIAAVRQTAESADQKATTALSEAQAASAKADQAMQEAETASEKADRIFREDLRK